MNRNGNRYGYSDTDFDRDRNGYRRRRRDGYDRYNDENDDFGYGRRAMGGRDYGTSGRYFDEGESYGRPREYGSQSRYPYGERRYNVAGYGGGRMQNDFYMRGDYSPQRGEGGQYGYGPSDDYQRGSYGRYDRNDYGREDRQRDRVRGRSDRDMYDQNRRGYEASEPYGRQTRYTDEGYVTDFRNDQIESRRQNGYGDFGSWSDPGPHTGRGPKGYERTTDRMREEVCERLTRHGGIDASDIEVKAENDEITLTGTVDSRKTKRMAEDVAESVPGVKDVHNQLRISKNTEQRNTEQEKQQPRNARRGASQQT